ncbi:LysR substrate-binding domain-containing protein [Aestuariimicrobium soli]|uniref:LysR substrate-binding domain-containing protein n=1 Tax=Aestuariimicrobium soli TaxID=2035834 RepID=UPI003EB994A2
MSDAWPDLAALDLLVAVAEHGSVGAAARSRGMEQPNATRSLARLERRLGAVLLERSPRGSTLTAAGLMVVEHARAALAAARDLMDATAALGRPDGAPVGERLVVGASQTIAEHLLPAWLATLRRRHPEIAVDVHVHNSHDVLDDLRSGRVGLGFIEDPTLGPGSLRGVHTLPVASDEMVLVVAPHHVWARRRRPVTLAELAETPMILRESGSGTRVALDEALGVAATSYLTVASNAAVRVAVASGAAPSVLSRLAVADAVGAGSLVAVPLATRITRPLHAVWVGRKRLTGAAAQVVALARG